MNIFRVLSIICAIALIVLLIVSLNVEASAGLTWAIVIVGIATAVFNVIATIAWWITDEANNYNSWQLSWYTRLHH